MFQAGLLKDRVIVVTGGGTGLGAEMARRFAELGAHPVVIGRRKEKLDEIASQISAAGGMASAYACDVRDPAQVAEVARATGEAPENPTPPQLLELRPHLRAVFAELEPLLHELEGFGVQLKGLDLGLIDFPAEMEGEIVLLCWQYGEKEVSYFHSPEDGFAGRKPLYPSAPRPNYLQ